MPLFAASAQTGRAFGRYGPPVPKFVEFLIMGGGGGRGGSAGPFYYERYKPWRNDPWFPAPGCQPHYLGAVAGSNGGAGGYISSVVGELSGRNTSPVPRLVPSAGTAYPISIGGAGGNASNGNGGRGGNTSAFGYTAQGGGGGGRPCCGAGSNGGSGGSGGGGGGSFPADCAGGCQGEGPCGSGSPGSGTSSQGFPASGVTSGGAGGAPTGIVSTITGTAVERSTGYGSATEGSASTRGGVILRYRGKDPVVSAGLSYSLYTVGANQVLELKGGSGTITW